MCFVSCANITVFLHNNVNNALSERKTIVVKRIKKKIFYIILRNGYNVYNGNFIFFSFSVCLSESMS